MIKKLIFLIFLTLFLSQHIIAQEEVCIALKSTSPHASQVCDAFKQLKEFWDYKEFAEGYIKDVDENKEPRKAPIKISEGETMAERLRATLNKINQVTITSDFTFKYFEYPSLEELGGDDSFKRSKAAEAAVLHLQEAETIYKNYNLLKKDFEIFLEEAKAVKSATNILRDSFFDIMQKTGNGLTEFSSMFGFAALDIINYISPLLGSIQSALTDKIKAIDNLLTTKKIAYNNLHYNTQYFLTAEKEALNGKLVVADSINKVRQKEGEKKAGDYNKMSKEIREDANNKIDGEYNRLMAEHKVIAKAQDSLLKMIDKVERLEKNYENLSFTICPNGKSYAQCDHKELKESYAIDKKNMKDRIASLKDEIKITLRIVNTKTVQYNKDYDAYKNLREKLMKDIELKEKKEQETIEEFKKEHNKIKEKIYWIKQYITLNEDNFMTYNKIAFE